MGINRRAPTSKKSVYTRSYPGFLGVDLSGSSASAGKRCAYAENMYRDYEAGDTGALESIPGFRKIFSTSNKINGLFLQRTADGETYVILQDGVEVKRFNPTAPEEMTPLTITPSINDKESFCFSYGDYLFLSNVPSLYRISDSGEMRLVQDTLASAPYVPTVYKNGRAFEQRNLLTSRFIESAELLPTSDYAYGTPGLFYKVTSVERRECAVTGISDTTADVFIPGRALLGEEYYTVTEIDNSAFSGNTSVASVTIADTVKRIGNGAFYACSALRRVASGDGLLEIGDLAFAESGLGEIYIPAGFLRFGDSALPTNCRILYELGQAGFESIENAPALSVSYGSQNKSITLGFKLKTPSHTIHSVKINGLTQKYTTLSDADGCVSEIIISVADKSNLTGSVLKVLASMRDYSAAPSDEGVDFTLFTKNKLIQFPSVIRNCTAAKTIDGRVFAWGHPQFPSVLFYSKRGADYNSALYFGTLDYINEGDGDKRIVSVLGLPDGIAVFTSAKDNAESIYFHTPEDSGGLRDRLYPVSEIHIGDGAVGESLNFGDDPVFVSEKGLLGIGENPLYLSRSVTQRSSSVSPALLGEKLSASRLALWRGYLVLSVGGKMYLADSRKTYESVFGKEYEWFILNGIGTYKNDERVYRYATRADDGYELSDTPDAAAEGTVYSEDRGSGLVYFVYDGDKKIQVYPTEEMTGGDFYPAERLLSFDGLLMFSTGCGDLCVFNSDMRGVPPLRIASAPDFDAEEYSRLFGNRIHSDFYDFAGHAARYALETIPDDCGLPHMAKRTLSGSLVIKLKCFIGSRVTLRASYGGDGYFLLGEYDAGVTDLSSLSFDTLSFTASEDTVIMPDERRESWNEKSISLLSEDFRSPVGVYSVSYLYRVTDRPKS